MSTIEQGEDIARRIRRVYALAIVIHEDEPDGPVTPDHLADLAEILATINVARVRPGLRSQADAAIQRFEEDYNDWWGGDLYDGWPLVE